MYIAFIIHDRDGIISLRGASGKIGWGVERGRDREKHT